jgi:signal transduction histidine kinase
VLVPPLPLAEAFERSGVIAAGGLGAAAILAFAGAALAMPRPAVRDLARRTVRSYSKRLVLVFTLLLVVPVALLYALLSRSLAERIERQQAATAEAALVSAQRVLGEYVLSLEPGFGLGTAIDDELLVWLSRVVQHEVSLYWGSEVYASSKRDLFAAGLLPRRIPGEAWARIALGGDSLARRTGRAGRAEYLELYAPLEIPGAPARTSRLFLAMPLLAQQEEALAETGRIRRRALLVTLALFLVLAASGSRLAASFTRPIEEFVAGTRRIAGGADRLGFRPAEAELEALAEAIDRMAATIAEGRERLVGEKLLVERIVENVTAGVVCLDREGRVLLANRVARELLAAAPGEELVERLERDPRLEPVAGFLAGRGPAPARAAVRLAGPAGDREWTLVWAPLEGPGEPAGLLVVEDVSEVLRGQRLEAWASMARIIAHEIKNPLTPIRLSAEHLREAWSRDREHFAAVFDRCTINILKQVEELREIASEFSIYSHVPRIDRQPGDLVAASREVAEAYRAAPPAGVAVRFVAEAEELPARFDAKLFPRALRNLLENAVRASAGRGEVEVRVFRRDGAAAIAVADQGPGVAPELLDRIFEPYFSTHAGGTGLGLPIARKIVEEHGGVLAARNRPSGGLEAVITIPLA